MSSVLIRERTEADLGHCLEIALTVKRHDNYPPGGPIDLDQFLAPSEQVAAWVAEDGSVVGHVALHSASDYESTRLACEYLRLPLSDLGMIARLFVHPDHRQSGAGQMLLAQATTAAIERGLCPVLDVGIDLEGAIVLYESAGWCRAGEVALTLWEEPAIQMYVYVLPIQ